MPKSPTSPPDDGDDRHRSTDIVARKKKNADAQAAFRQRRATYISSLEETVVKMEEVVLQLQTSCKEYHTQTDALKQEVKRLKFEGRERERLWQAAWFNRASRGGGHPDDPLPVPESSLFGAVPVSPTVTQASPTMTQASNSYDERYNDGGMAYNNTSYNSGSYGASTSSLAYATTQMDPRSQQAQQHQQQQQYGPYMIASSGSHGSWQPSGSETIPPSTTPPTHSPTAYSDHRNPMVYNRFMDPSQPAAVESNTYMVEQSPTNSSPSTPISTTSAAPHGAHYNYGLIDTSDRSESIYPRTNGHGHGIPMTLHGGLADVSASLSSSRGYRPEVKLPTTTNSYTGGQNPMSSPTHAVLSPTQDFPPSTPSGPPAGSGSSNKSHEHEQTPSRSPSPAADSQISQTLAVIKQQAFGTMRRTNRTRSKASSSNAAKAIEKLEARGVNLGLGRLPKRPRSDSDDEDGHM